VKRRLPSRGPFQNEPAGEQRQPYRDIIDGLIEGGFTIPMVWDAEWSNLFGVFPTPGTGDHEWAFAGYFSIPAEKREERPVRPGPDVCAGGT
jgi:hypothetical protein